MSPRVLLAGLLVSTVALAQIEPPELPKVADDGGAPRVYYAHSSVEEHWGTTENWTTAGLDDLVSVHVQNFESLLKQTGNMCTGIVLFIDGMAIQGLQPLSCDVTAGHVRFRMLRTERSNAVWDMLLGSPAHYLRTVSISVGATDQFSVPTSVNSFHLEVIPRLKLFLFIGMSVGGLLLLLWLCSKRGLIRTGPTTMPMAKRPYNLSLFQMAFWFFLVVAAYLFIWMINDELDTITDSVLALLGIGAGTALGSVLIDKNKQPAGAQDSAALPPEAGKPPESQGFLNDVLTDESRSLSLHRFQLFAWTLVLGVIFCGSVYSRLEMPNFSPTLLGLMGISAGTFLGFKVPEGKRDDGVAPAVPSGGGSGAV
jgi:hypothetical protein